ncbi:UNVERIFIED_CONTAM: IS110 family transposase [Actinomycetes bacterium ARC8]|nr:IS110 family transposase [Actinomycetes bacterium ARC8]
MTIVSQTHQYVVGVDTHAKKHVYAIIAATTGEHIDTRDFPTSSAGITRALNWVGKRTLGDAGVLWVIEGCASYGAILAGTVSSAGYQVAEAPRMGAKARHGVGKSDSLDALRIAAAVLPLQSNQLRTPRLNDGVRAALRVLLAARDSMTTERTSSVNALTALLRTYELGMDARKALTAAKIIEAAKWRERNEDLALSVARAEAIRLAQNIVALDEQLKDNMLQLTELVTVSEAAPLLDMTGCGPVTAAVALTTWSHRNRVRSEAAFASLAGVNPIPASSGNTVRHRLNRGGDRRLNKALHMVAVTRMVHDKETRIYAERRKAEGKTVKEVRRCIKRYLARSIYRILNATVPAPSST